jgi:hypothetical protein
MLAEKTKVVPFEKAWKQAKWRVVMFDKNGKSYRGKLLFDSQAEAAARAMDVMRKHKERLGDKSKDWYWDLLDGNLFRKDYAWHMTMPVIEPN